MPRASSILPEKREQSQKPPRKRSSLSAVEEGWSLRDVAGLEILTANIFDSLPWMAHGFSTRKGGASKIAGKTASKTNVPAALNLGFTEWDSRQTVARNRAAFLRAVLSQKLGQKPTPQSAPRAETAESLVTLRQIHSNVVRIFHPGSDGAASRCRNFQTRRPVSGDSDGRLRPNLAGRSAPARSGRGSRRMARDACAYCREDARPDAAGVRHQSRRCSGRAWPGDWPLLL